MNQMEVAMTPELAIAVLRSMAQEDELEPADALLDLIRLLARTHETMDNDDWEVIATAGGLLWRAEMGEVESEAQFAALMRRLKG
jgi:hypothetical protein